METTFLAKLFGLLEATAGQSAGRSLAELASEVGLPKPTAHRILKALSAMGYMEKVGNGVYRQTDALKRLVTGAEEGRLIRIAEPAMRQLHRQTQETVNLGILKHGRITYLHVLESPQPLRRIVNPNMSDPFSCTALGRAIVAHLPEERQNFLLKTVPVEKRTPYTIIDPVLLKKVLSTVREQGYATEENETDIGVMCIGCPIFDDRGVVAALSVSAPTVRVQELERATLIERIRQAATSISERLRRETGAS